MNTKTQKPDPTQNDIALTRITAILIRIINELAGGEQIHDSAVAQIADQLLELCCKPNLSCSHDEGRQLWNNAIDLLDEKAWLFSVQKMGDLFEFEVKVGKEIATAQLPKNWITAGRMN